jgi:hypothetical protein
MVNKGGITIFLATSVINSDVEVTLEAVKSFGDRAPSWFAWGENKFGTETKQILGRL